MKYTFIICFIYAMVYNAQAQSILKANNVQVVVTPNTRLVTQGGLTYTGNTMVHNDGIITLLPSSIKEHWLDSTAAGALTASSVGTVVFSSDSVQFIYGKSKFYNLVIQNDSSVLLLNSVQVSNQLNLNKGLVTTIADTLIVTNPAVAAVQSTTNYTASWVNGKLARASNVANTDYIYPIGKLDGSDSFYAPIKLDKANTNTAMHTAEYFWQPPIDFNNFATPPIRKLSKLEYWHIASSNIAAAADDNAKVSLSYRNRSVVSAIQQERDSLVIVQYISTPTWELTGGQFPSLAIVTGDANFGFVKHRNAYVSFMQAEKNFTLASLSLFNILPYQVLNWNAQAQQQQVALTWSVAYEQDVVSYTIEKSSDGFSFAPIYTTVSLRLAANNYTAYDYAPTAGFTYYRLVVTNVQGQLAYAGVRKVWYGTPKHTGLALYPNPASNVLTLTLPSYTGFTTVQVYNTIGKLVMVHRTSLTVLQLNVAKLTTGIYTIKVQQGALISSQQFSKQ